MNHFPQTAAHLPAPASPPIIGERYRLTSKLGSGGFGVVYLAHDLKLHERPVVIKAMTRQPYDQYQDWRLKKFRQEAEALARLNHPGIVSVLDRGDLPDGRPYLVMEFVSGLTLQDEIAHTPLALPRIGRLLQQLGAALDAVHACGISHRDLKPTNIMLQNPGTLAEQAKLIDFGIAHVRDSLWTGQSGAVVAGTRNYMSPEQLQGQVKDFVRSDIYSLGIIAYEMIAGQVPFASRSDIELFEKQKTMRLVLPPERVELSPALLPVLHKALAFDPAARPGSASEFSNALAPLLQPSTRSSWPTDRDLTEPALPPTPIETQPLPHTPPAAEPVAEPVGGAMPLDSRFYIVRATDDEFSRALLRRDSIVLLKGARQMGKTSLLARGLQQARAAGARVVLTDLQSFNAPQLDDIDNFLRTLADDVAEQLELSDDPLRDWDERRGASRNFSRFLERRVLPNITSQLVWGLDEIDRLFSCAYGSEVFGLFRSWHNARSLNPQTPLHKLTLAIAYATEAHLFITDLNQSPFNVGTRLALDDFKLADIAELNRRYQQPLKTQDALERFYRLVGGQPYLVRLGLKTMSEQQMEFTAFAARAAHEDGPYGDHLRRLSLMLMQDTPLCEAMRSLLQGHARLSLENFYRLRSAGVLVGESVQEVRPRCQLYAEYLRLRLL